jgi:hypothetical protein
MSDEILSNGESNMDEGHQKGTADISMEILSYFQLSPQEMTEIKEQLNRIALTPDELLSRKKVLRVHEVSYILNVSNRHVRRMIDRGKLLATKIRPIRVSVEAVKEMLSDVGLWESAEEAKMDLRAFELGLDREE